MRLSKQTRSIAALVSCIALLTGQITVATERVKVGTVGRAADDVIIDTSNGYHVSVTGVSTNAGATGDAYGSITISDALGESMVIELRPAAPASSASSGVVATIDSRLEITTAGRIGCDGRLSAESLTVRDGAQSLTVDGAEITGAIMALAQSSLLSMHSASFLLGASESLAEVWDRRPNDWILCVGALLNFAAAAFSISGCATGLACIGVGFWLVSAAIGVDYACRDTTR